jgi:hypothetical protein
VISDPESEELPDAVAPVIAAVAPSAHASASSSSASAEPMPSDEEVDELQDEDMDNNDGDREVDAEQDENDTLSSDSEVVPVHLGIRRERDKTPSDSGDDTSGNPDAGLAGDSEVDV